MEGSFRILLLLTVLSACNMLLVGVGGVQHLHNETDRQALMAFKGEIDDDPYGVLSSWNNSMHFCDWQGVICGSRHQRVVGMNLGSLLELKGRISPHIANLTFLRFISLPNNRLHGEIPHELGRLPRLAVLSLGNNSLEGAIPATLSNCSNLQSILLNSNRLAGQVPPELGLLSRLRGFLIGGNRFTGVFPPFLTNLTSLTNLSLALNSFHGEIPEGIGKLSGLRTFLLGGNNFSGELPSTIYNLSNMLAIDLPQNQLSGVLSPRMGDFFPKLQHVNLLYNYFSGSIPVSLSNASNLRSLTFAGNGFVGSIPSDVGKLQDLFWFDFADNLLGAGSGDDLLFLITSLTNCTKLTLLGLANNTLLGQLPASIANLSRNIFELSLGNNFIHGRIPPGFENILSLERFSLTSNFLTGPIPAEFGQLPNLGDISLYQNNLEGQIPVSLGNLSHLVLFSLGQNQLQGRIPASLGNCSNLQKLGLPNNALSGSIPSQLFNLKSMITFDLSSNLLSGNLPSEVGQLQNLNQMDLSSNNLSGSIPTSLGNCRSLVSLDLSHNSFASAIPMSLAAMSAVDEVDLSSNNLTGVIPTYFTKFNLLRILNLSFNDLEGEVPTLGPFKNASRVSVLGNNKLCGGVLELHLPSCFKTNDTRGHKGRLLLLKLILPLAIGTSTLIFVCCVLAYYRRKWSRNDPAPFISMNQQHMQVTYAELHRATNGFSAANLIGSGSFGTVFRGTLIDSYQMDVAIKVINSVEHASLQSFTAECDALKKVRHRNVVKILTSCSSLDFQGNEFRALVYKFMPNGSLDSWVHPTFGQDLYLSFSRRLDIAMDVANALDYLHNHCETPIVHCDLKPNNILLDGEMVAHVSDFGLAKVLVDVGDDSSCTSMLKGSIGYIPPEYGASYKVTPHGDVYSYGVLLLELFTGKRPTDELFRDGIDISKYAKRHFHGRLMETVDQTLLLHESNEHNLAFQDCLSCVIGIGLSCTSELPQKRKKMSSVCMELQAAIEKYKKEQMKKIDG